MRRQPPHSKPPRAVQTDPAISTLLLALIRQARGRPLSCLYCGSESIVGWGSFSGRRRYRCKRCLRTFSDLSGTFLRHTRRLDHWPEALRCLESQGTLRDMAKTCGIGLVTAFRWRHLVLEAQRTLPPRPFSGEVVVELQGLLHQRPRRNPGASPRGGGMGPGRVLVILGCHRGQTPSEVRLVAGDPGTETLDPSRLKRLLGPWVYPSTRLQIAGRAVPWRSQLRGLGLGRIPAGSEGPSRHGFRQVRWVGASFRRWLKPFCGIGLQNLDRYCEWFRFLGEDEKRRRHPETPRDHPPSVGRGIRLLLYSLATPRPAGEEEPSSR